MTGTASNNTLNTYLRASLEPLMVQYNVNLALWGHVHKYERTCGVIDFACLPEDSQAPVHVVIGMAGNTDQVSCMDSSDGRTCNLTFAVSMISLPTTACFPTRHLSRTPCITIRLTGPCSGARIMVTRASTRTHLSSPFSSSTASGAPCTMFLP